MKTCRIPYENACRTGVRILPIASRTGVRILPIMVKLTHQNYVFAHNYHSSYYYQNEEELEDTAVVWHL